MHIGWREFLTRRFIKPAKYLSLGIEYGIDELHLTTLQNIKGQLCWVKQHTMDSIDWVKQLHAYVAEQQLNNTPCHVSLALNKYQLLQLDKPAVPETEINQALNWTVREQVFSDGELAIDYFDLPAAPANSKKINVVALDKSEIVTIRNGVLAAGLALHSIGIEELSACQLIAGGDEAALIVQQSAGEQLSLRIIKNGILYFSRRLRGYENLATFSEQELQMGIVDNLCLEIQRSMDYFESQLRQAPLKKVYILLETPHQTALCKMIGELIFLNVSELQVPIQRHESLAHQPLPLTSLGAGLEIVGGSL